MEYSVILKPVETESLRNLRFCSVLADVRFYQIHNANSFYDGVNSMFGLYRFSVYTGIGLTSFHCITFFFLNCIEQIQITRISFVRESLKTYRNVK